MVAQHVGQLEPRLVEKGPQILIAIGPQLGNDLRPAVPDLAADVLEDDLLRLSIHQDLTAGGEKGEASLDVALQPAARLPGQGPQPKVETKLLAVVPDKVQDSENGF